MTENIQHLPHCVLHHLIKPTKLRRRSHIYYTYIQIQTNVRMNNMRFDDKHQTISTQYTEKNIYVYIYASDGLKFSCYFAIFRSFQQQ